MKKQHFLNILKEEFQQNGDAIKDFKSKIIDLKNDYKIAESATDKKEAFQKLNAAYSRLKELKSITSLQNMLYFIIKRNGTKEADLMLTKHWQKIRTYFRFKYHAGFGNISGPYIVFEDEKCLIKPKSELLDKSLFFSFDAMRQFIAKIEKYGRHFAEELKIKHPFDLKYAGLTIDFYEKREGWSFSITDDEIIIHWAEEEGSCGSYDWTDKFLKIPLLYFSEINDLQRAEIERKIEIKENIRELESELKKCRNSINSTSIKIRDSKNKFQTLKRDYEKLFSIPFSADLEKEFYADQKKSEEELAPLKSLETQLLASIQDLNRQI